MNVQSLIRIFNHPLIFGVKARHHRVIVLSHRGVNILRTLSDGLDSLMDGQCQRMPVDEVKPFHARQNVETTIDG